MKVLVVGAGGREHALVQALARSPSSPELLCAPGNPGIAQQARTVEVAVDDVEGIVSRALLEDVDLVVVGPEVPLVAGLGDALGAVDVPCFGPIAAGAALEGSKAFCKEVMDAAAVPTARHQVVETVEDGLRAVEGYPTVIKADGLAAGKGVVIAADESEARAALQALLVERRFGTERVLVEEHLVGREVSLFAVCDGRRALPLTSAQDYKRIFDGDGGPNTGGMGCYSPAAGIGGPQAADLVERIHQPVLDELARRDIPFHGVLYAGLMMTGEGPRVLEFNTRFGDPETQAMLPRLRSDLLELLAAATEPGGLDAVALDWDPRPAVTVVLASAGYPESASTGDVIEGLDDVGDDVFVTHAGTARDSEGRLVTAGGRVLGVTALGDDTAAARANAYAAADMIEFEGRQLRSDIAAGVR